MSDQETKPSTDKKEYQKEYYEKNKERLSELRRKWAKEHPDRIKTYNEKNRETIQANYRKWYQERKDDPNFKAKRSEYHREYYLKK